MGIIKPSKGKSFDLTISKHAIMIIPKRYVNYIPKRFKTNNLGEIDGCLYRLYITLNNVAICGPFLGAPQAVLGLEKLIALGAKNIWIFSWCGSIKKDIRIGDIIIPEDAFSDEGTSKHYPISSKPSFDSNMIRSITNKLKQKNIQFFKGPLWTTDAPYRETEDKIKEYQQKGAIGVDMEISALMTVSTFRSVSIAGIFVVSDELFSGKWKPGFSNPLLNESSQKAIDILIELSSVL